MYKHLFIKNGNETLILLHGTGGNEHDLMNLAKIINPEASILSFRGKVSENGLNRFFKRRAPGVYDLENYVKETKDLKEAITNYSKTYNFDLNHTTVVGFSNGANIALGLIQDYPKLTSEYILFSPDFINPNKVFQDLSHLKVFISTADDDPYVNFGNILYLTKIFKDKGVRQYTYFTKGHQITEKVLNEARDWHKKKL